MSFCSGLEDTIQQWSTQKMLVCMISERHQTIHTVDKHSQIDKLNGYCNLMKAPESSVDESHTVVMYIL